MWREKEGGSKRVQEQKSKERKRNTKEGKRKSIKIVWERKGRDYKSRKKVNAKGERRKEGRSKSVRESKERKRNTKAGKRKSEDCIGKRGKRV